MKKYLLPQGGKFYKANLHMHTTVSDGELTPEEAKSVYQERGYSILAYTDHNILVSHEDLTDENFVVITAVEFDVGIGDSLPYVYGGHKTYHFNLYAKNPKNVISSIFSEKRIWPKYDNSRDYVTEEMRKYDEERWYSQQYMNGAIQRARKEGFFVSYNHPVWSLQNYTDYCDLKGLWGVEVYNHGCFLGGYVDTVQPLDDLLRTGQQVFPLAGDDSHGLKDSFGGWVMVKAEQLTYNAVILALESGDFYASTGPEIKELYIEDGILKVFTSKVSGITFSSDRRLAKKFMAEDGATIEYAEFDLTKFIETGNAIYEKTGKNSYIRIMLEDKNGKSAYSRAYFLDDLQ